MTKKTFWRARNIVLISVGVLVLLAIGFGIISSRKPKAVKTSPVEHGSVVSEISGTGKVVPVANIDLAFERAGRITAIYTKVGAKVGKGDRLAELENADLRAQLAQAQANVRAQQARLEELQAGTRPEQIRIKETELAKSKQDLENLYGGAKDLANDAFAKSDDAVRGKIADLFLNAETPNPKLSFQTTNSQAEIDVVALRSKVGAELNTWRAELGLLSYGASQETLASALESARTRSGLVNDLLAKALDAVDGSLTLSETTKTTYKTNINTARTSVNAVRTALTSQIQNIASQKSTITRVEQELALQRAGSTKEQIDAQKAQVDQAQANALYALSQLEKTILRAPFAGKVTKSEKSAGDIVSANESVVSLIGAGKYQIEVNIAESDIAKIKVGNLASVTFDAYGSDVIFNASVVQVDLSETVIDNVATYKTVLEFSQEDAKIISGLTANVNILNERKDNVLFVYSRNIISENGAKYIQRLKDEKTMETERLEIKTGLRGTDGKTEIISGIAEGDLVVTE
jgi:HlyD family secretion protein